MGAAVAVRRSVGRSAATAALLVHWSALDNGGGNGNGNGNVWLPSGGRRGGAAAENEQKRISAAAVAVALNLLLQFRRRPMLCYAVRPNAA